MYLNILHMLHCAPLRYVDLPAESMVDLWGLTKTLVKKKKKKNLPLFQLCMCKQRTSLNPLQVRDSSVKRDSEWERERPEKKKRLRSCLGFEVQRTGLVGAAFFPNTSLDVGASSPEMLRLRLNWDPDIKRLNGIVERRRHRTLYLPECGRSGAFALPVCSLHRCVCVRRSSTSLFKLSHRPSDGSGGETTAGPVLSLPRALQRLVPRRLGPGHKTPFGSQRVKRKMLYRSKCDHLKIAMPPLHSIWYRQWGVVPKKCHRNPCNGKVKDAFSEQLHSGQQPSECRPEQLAQLMKHQLTE